MSKKGGKKESRPASAAGTQGGGGDELDRLGKMELALRALADKLADEQRERNYFQLERDKVNSFWEITKRERDELKADVRNKERELEESEERHQVELKIYKQKVRHLLYEHKLAVDQLKLESEMALKLKEDAQRSRESDLKREKRESRVSVKEQELNHERVVRKLRQDHDKATTKMREEFERQTRELQLRYEKMMNQLREEMNQRRKNEVIEIEQRKNQHIRELMEQHEKAFREIKEYYNDITSNNIELIKSLKQDLEDMKKDEATNEKDLFDTIQENKKLREPLARTLKEVEKLRQEKMNYEKDKLALRNAKVRLKVLDQQLKDMQWEHEVMQQRFNEMQRERDDLYSKFELSVSDAERRAGYRNILLEKKVESLSDILEKRNVQLTEVMQAANLDPSVAGAVTMKLDDVLDEKNAEIRDLQLRLAQVTKAHNDVIRVVEQKLHDHGVPVEDLGFRPLVAKENMVGEGPSGLVSG